MVLRLTLQILNGSRKGDLFPLKIGQIFSKLYFSDDEMLQDHAETTVDSGSMWSIHGLSEGKIRIGSAETDRISLIPGVVFHLGQTGFKVIEIPAIADNKPDEELITWLESQKWEKRPSEIHFFDPGLRLSFVRGPQAGEFYTLSYGPRVLGFNNLDLDLIEPGLPKEAVYFSKKSGNPALSARPETKALINDLPLIEHFVKDGDVLKIGLNEIEIVFVK